MDMGNIIAYCTGTLLLFGVLIYSWHLFWNKKVDWKNHRIYLAIVIATMFGALINFCLPPSLKVFLIVILMVLISYVFFCKNLTKSILAVLVSEFIGILCESLVVAITFFFIGNNPEYISQNIYGMLLVNFGVPVLIYLSLKTKLPVKIYGYLFKTFNNMKQSNLIIYFVLIILLISIFLVMIYMKLPITFVLICNTVLAILYIVVILKLANSQENFRKINTKYETSLSSLKEYEDIMDRYRIDNHENKNQLLTIRNMVKAKDKKVPSYIDKLVDNKIKDNENVFYKTSKIPEGGLRATIYSKLCKIREMDIDYILDISNDVRTVDLINIGDSTMLNICKIIGVFLDNAIEEVSKLDKKEITVELFLMDSNLCIDISNNYVGNINIEEMDKARFTTKGDGHGYGLALVNELLHEDSNLENVKTVINDKFTQRLKIKM